MTAAEFMAPLAALAGEAETGSGNNTTVNAYFNAPGAAYCGYSIWYAARKSGSKFLDACANPAYVPTLKTYLAVRAKIVPNAEAAPGDVFAYGDQHVGLVWAPYAGNTVITLEGNSAVYATEELARQSYTGTGAFEGIGYKKRQLTSGYTVYRPDWSAAGAVSSPDTQKPAQLCAVKLELVETGRTVSAGTVAALQAILTAKGFRGADGKTLTVDGKFGPNTAAAVCAAQKKLGLDVDGACGADTWPALIKM